MIKKNLSYFVFSVTFIFITTYLYSIRNNKLTSNIKRSSNKGIDIQKAMDYPIPHILERYQKDYNVSSEIAKKHERELKRYLIICADNIGDPIWMFSAEIDNLWHTFILFTREYEYYCKNILGKFIHHEPKDPHEEKSN